VVGRNYSNAALELEIPEDHPSMTQTSCSELVNSMDCAASCCKWTWANESNITATERRRLAKAKSKGSVGGETEDIYVEIIEDGTCAPTSFGESVCAVEMIESTGAKLRIFWKELDSPNHLYFLYYSEVDDCSAELDKYGEAPLNAEGCATTTQQRGRCGSDVPDNGCIMETACGIRRNGCFVPMDGDASTLDHCTDEESLKNLDLYSDVYDGVVMGGNDNIKVIEGERRRLSISAFQHDGTADEEIAARWFYMDVPVKNNMSYYFNVIHQEALPEDVKCTNCPKVWEGSYAGTHAVAEYNRPLQLHSDQTILQLFGFIGIATLLLLIPFFALKFFIKSRLLKVFESSKLPSILKLKAKAAYMNLLSGVNKAKNKFKNLKKKKQIHPGGGGLASLAASAGKKKKKVGGLAALAQASAVQGQGKKKKINMGATKMGPSTGKNGNGTTTDEDNRVEAF